MQRFKKYIGKDFIIENIKNSEQLNTYGITCRDLPEPFSDFEEVEISIDFVGQEILLGVAVLEGKVKRIMFGMLDKENPDVFRPLTEMQLKDLLDQRGEQLANFFEYITK